MTPEQQIREAFEELYLRATEKQAWLEELRDTHEAALDRLVADLDATEELRRRAIAEADRLVAERDEARRDYDEATDELATELAQARIEANEAEGREAALREALPTDAELARLREHARAARDRRNEMTGDGLWTQYLQHIVTIADNLAARGALAGVPADEPAQVKDGAP